MATRIKEGMIPYTGGDGIEITDNHVINVLLRAANNLIHVNEDRELYVDLQLPAGIAPDDDFPVGVTTGEILAEDGWEQSGTIINSKTTSGDYVRLIYANDGNLYYDPGTGVWIMIGSATQIDVNTKTFFLTGTTGETNLATAQAAIDYIRSGKNALLMLNYGSSYGDTTLGSCCTLTKVYFSESPEIPEGFLAYDFCDSIDANNIRNYIRVAVDAQTGDVLRIYQENIDLDGEFVMTHYAQTIAGTKTFTTSPVVPNKTTPATNTGTAIATEAQVYLKQDKLTAGSGITIDSNTNTISANIQGALVYKGNVADVASLPSSGNTVGDVYYVEADGLMYAWDGTTWKAVGNTQIDLSNYFNVTTNTTDDITQGSTNLFVTQAMIDAWNGKQGALTAGTNIQINNGVISATDTTYSAGTGIGITGTTINNTAPFSPENQGAVGQVLKRTSTGVRRANGISVEGTSLGAYLKACVENGAAHKIPVGTDTTYTFKGIGYIIVDTMYGYTLNINGVDVFRYPFDSGTYTPYRYLGPYTMGKGDVARIWREGMSGSGSFRVIDYYKEGTPQLYFTAEAPNSTIQLTKVGTPGNIELEKSSDGVNWTDYTIGDTITLAIEGEKVYLRNKSIGNTSFSHNSSNYYKFVMTGSIAVSGDINYLVSKYSNSSMNPYHFYNLFYNCASLTQAPSLPITTLTHSCYKFMFRGCTGLTTAPTLPATTLIDDCYNGMFMDCTSLVTLPELPATTLALDCYAAMFSGCTSLTTVPVLPATTLVEYCYSQMFQGCTSLNALPALPATTLPGYCYYGMFSGCSNIKVSTTQTGEYQNVFRMPATGTGQSVGSRAMYYMFEYTGGTYTGNPSMNTDYYTSNNIIS